MVGMGMRYLGHHTEKTELAQIGRMMMIGGLLGVALGYSIRIIRFRRAIAFAYFTVFAFSSIRFIWQLYQLITDNI